MLNQKKIISVILLVIIITAVFFAVNNFSQADSENGAQGQNVQVVISSGMGVFEIAAKLYESKAIDSLFAFELYNIFTGRASKFKPGVYELKINSSVKEVSRILIEGPKEIEIVIFPGMTLKEIDKALSSAKIIPEKGLTDLSLESLKDQFPFLEKAKSLEGFLYPDTYNFLPATDPQIVAIKILENFKQKITHTLSTWQLKDSGDIINKLILASLLEKEVIDNREQKIVAGILENRLKKNMPLQVDATIIYAKCDGKFLNCPALSKEDYQKDSLYNTYKYKGLPPTPISNPTLQSIEAALSPINTNYFYYLSDPLSKKTIFSVTFEEHNKNRVKYLNK